MPPPVPNPQMGRFDACCRSRSATAVDFIEQCVIFIEQCVIEAGPDTTAFQSH